MWKTMNSKKINERLASQLPQLNNLPLNDANELDNWIKAFLGICQQAITKFVRTSTPSKYSKSGWNSECSEAGSGVPVTHYEDQRLPGVVNNNKMDLVIPERTHYGD
jgi:hypothetical protein